MKNKIEVELAKEYYPLLWNKTRIKMLYEKGIITKEEYKEITNEEYI